MHIWTDTAKPAGTSWTDIPKPILISGSKIISQVGVPIGLLMALTYATTSSITTQSSWTDVPKPSGTTWTDIIKAT